MPGDKRANAERWLILALLGLFLVLRWPLLRLPPFGDEDLLIRDAAALGRSNLTGYPILGLAILRLGLSVVGFEGLRWLPFAFSLGVLALTALLANQLLGRRAAAWAMLLLAVAPLSVSAAAQLVYDGAFVAFFALAAACAYRRSVSQDSVDWRYAVLCGLSTGCLAMTSYAVVVLTAGLALHCWLTRGLKTALRLFAVVGAVAAAVFAIYPLLFPEHCLLAARKPAGTIPGAIVRKLASSPSLYLRSLSKALIFVGPLPVWGAWLALARKELRLRAGLALCAALTYMTLVLLLVDPDRTVGYWAAILPFLCVATAGAVCEVLPNQDGLVLPATAFAAGFAALTLAGPKAVQAIHPAIRWTLSGLFEFMPTRIFYGPSLATYFKPAAVLLGFAGVPVLAAAAALRPRLNRLLVALGLAYGLFYSSEYSYSLFSPNLNRVGAAVAESLKASAATQPVYLHGYGALACERLGLAVTPFMYDVPLMPRLIQTMASTGGSVVLLNAPAIGPDTDLRRFLAAHGQIEQSFQDDGVTLAEIWRLKKGP